MTDPQTIVEGMTKEVVRVPTAPGSREPSPTVSAASGFDPSRDLNDAYQVVGEMLQYFDSHKLATWAPIAATIQQQRTLGRMETLRVVANIVDALDLAANRLSLHAVNAIASGDLRSSEYSSWASEARALLRTLPPNFRDSDGSGEADKTGTGLAVGDSAGRRHRQGEAMTLRTHLEKESKK